MIAAILLVAWAIALTTWMCVGERKAIAALLISVPCLALAVAGLHLLYEVLVEIILICTLFYAILEEQRVAGGVTPRIRIWLSIVFIPASWLLYPLLVAGKGKQKKLQAAFQSTSPAVRAMACAAVFVGAMMVGFVLCAMTGWILARPWESVIQRELRECFLDVFVLVPFFIFMMKLYFDESITLDPWVELSNFAHIGSAYFGGADGLRHVDETEEEEASEKMDAQQTVLEHVAMAAIAAFVVGVLLRTLHVDDVVRIVPFSEAAAILFAAMGVLTIAASLADLPSLRELTGNDEPG